MGLLSIHYSLTIIMSNKINELFQETVQENREQFLSDIGATREDVLEDEKGAFVFSFEELGHPSEDGCFETKKVYLPANCQYGF